MFDRKAHWQNVYQDKSALNVSWYQKKPELSIELFRRTQVASDESIIDVGGGASVLIGHLLKEGYLNLAVLDISANALDSAKKDLAVQQKALSGLKQILLNLRLFISFRYGMTGLFFIS